jgi:hypothetical protein
MILNSTQHMLPPPTARLTLTSSCTPPNTRCCCRIHDTEDKYYADGEDAYGLRLTFSTGEKAAAAEKQQAAAAAAGTPDKASPGGRKGGKRR